ncbi:CubicO group peptidase (beta-lactamase class C family) [Dokdonella fugitiva]|uniref:CubicO group peptidase (Beta-lactamase class C family) n=1 Tax=Dokdonella fugitiva TaxID=328517 RepID=A0A839F882_9GAMM|nr:serine hydrolase [Dokdonella fugitiva]MBA8889748.1 CubicO group peptidase (beta-lactamase class C family) [Dokdonella fugitiva]
MSTAATLRFALVALFASFGAAPGARAGAAAGGSAATTTELAGLWKARRWFGPLVRGALTIRKERDGWRADLAGRDLPVRVDGDALAFEMPGGEGRFEGRLERTRILGHWYPPPNSATFGGGVFVSPVRLRADATDRWSGSIVPAEDTFSFHLLATPRADGSFDVLLRNAERDFGLQIGVERLRRDGDALVLLGKRRDETTERELARGSWDRERDVMRFVFPGRGGSYDFSRDGDASTFWPRGRTPARYTYRAPLARDDGWPSASLDDVDIDRAGIERFVQRLLDAPMDAVDAPLVDGVVLARHGKLVLEEYFHGFERDAVHDTRSAAKSLTSIVVGAAIEAGAPLALDSPVYRVMNGGAFADGLDPRKRAMTLEHLLTMSSGYWCDDTEPGAPGNEQTMLDQETERDYYRYILALPMAHDPGVTSIYGSINPHLALGMVAAARGESPLYAFDRLVGDPLRIDHYAWLLDPAGHPYGGGSVQLRLRDFAKLGQLMLDDGRWHGRRILGHDYVARASAPLYHLRNVQYGYLWWGEDFPYRDRSVHAFLALGAGGQSITVVPALDLVVAIYSGNYASRRQIDAGHHFVPRFILPAVRERGEPRGAPVTERAYATPYGPSKDGSRIR